MVFIDNGAEETLGLHPRELDVWVPLEDASLRGTLNVPHGARGVVGIFAPLGRSRYDAPCRFFAQVLEQAGLATLCLDAPDQAKGDEPERVVSFLRSESFTAALPIGLLGFAPGSALAVPGVAAWLETSAEAPQAAELASEFFIARLAAPGA